MLVVMKAQATPEQIQAVCDYIAQLGFRAHPLPGAQRTAIGITGNKGEVERGNLEELSGVAEVIRVSKAYKLASRDVKEEDTVINFPGTDASIGGRNLAIVAGPCSIETPRAGLRHRGAGCRGRRAVLSWRSFQAPHKSLCISGPRS